MVRRICPNCGKGQFSSVEQEDWTCSNCGARIPKELNEVIRSETTYSDRNNS
ncbi:hypothetical protein [Mesotoga sp. UBA5847]|jgi:ribosomal protein L37AE/L43A|uniref:hypothetical protein n=1 Tax=Mesotoga sp. UBA5847 TaxID=1946859 RepID=UPI0039C8D543